MSDKYSEANVTDVFTQKGNLESLWCRFRVKQALGKIGVSDIANNILVVEDRRRARLSTRIPGRRWNVTPVHTNGVATDELIQFDSDDSSELPTVDYDQLTPEGILAIARVARRGGKIVEAAAVAEILNNPPPTEVPNPLALLRAG